MQKRPHSGACHRKGCLPLSAVEGERSAVRPKSRETVRQSVPALRRPTPPSTAGRKPAARPPVQHLPATGSKDEPRPREAGGAQRKTGRGAGQTPAIQSRRVALGSFTPSVQSDSELPYCNMTTKFQAWMDAHQYSQYRLHKLTGFNKSQISEWQHGKHRPSLKSAQRLAFTLRMSLQDLKSQLELRENTQNARTPEGQFVPRSKQNSRALAETNESGRTDAAYCLTCHRLLDKAA